MKDVWRYYLDEHEARKLATCEASLRTINGRRMMLSVEYRRTFVLGWSGGRAIRENTNEAKALRAQIEMLNRARRRQEEFRRAIQQRAAERARYAARKGAAA